ncbi:MotA/TolQ/ExbB proton channel family protein [Amycolatopsis suaedae]|uniref:Uncharacterized protein n=1 Tax=Amycolatopsis suaedae TaxID=2510978 RepID=A0A4Q7JAU9_9PSEU|nr:MotA/TolQ/ExbB proton channel family protein [Amycolatopsis suaedae]RZQ64397.1 hypothetical protein EWH70_10575 [Amycolatopsis suaedae]
MTTTSPTQDAGTPPRKSKVFLATGAYATIITAIAAPLGLFDWLPVIGGLLRRGGAVSGIAILVMGFSLWILLFVLARLSIAAKEGLAARSLRAELAKGRPLATEWAPLPDTVVAQRVAAYRAAPGNATTALAARSELDHALGELSYVPARALVWALPALGFLGTAAEMSSAVGGLTGSLGQTTGYAELRNALVSNVIPPLADAFGATLFALGAAVVCHLLLTWTTAREQRVLLDIEEVTLDLAGPPRSTPAASPALNGELTTLTDELARTRAQMSMSATELAGLDLDKLTRLGHLDQLERLAELTPLLRSVDQRLDRIHAELSRDLVITRLSAQEGVRR